MFNYNNPGIPLFQSQATLYLIPLDSYSTEGTHPLFHYFRPIQVNKLFFCNGLKTVDLDWTDPDSN